MISRKAIADTVFYLCLIAAAVCCAIFVLLPEWRKKNQYQEQRDELVRVNQELSRNIADFASRQEALQSDNPDALMKIANDQKLYGPDDVVFVFPEDP